jgi:hypothetical protein
MTAEMPAADPEVELELDRCIDQLLATGGWEVRMPSGIARGEVDRLMGVAALLRSLTRYTKTKRPRPNQKDRIWPSVSNSFHLWRARFSRPRSRLDRPVNRLEFGSI